MYPDSGYKLAHAQSVCTSPFSPRWEGPGDEASGTPYACTEIIFRLDYWVCDVIINKALYLHSKAQQTQINSLR